MSARGGGRGYAAGLRRGLGGPLGPLRDNPAMVAIAVATAISMMGQGVISPVLPRFARDLGIGATAVGMVVGAFGLSRLFVNIPAGVAAQRFGRTALMSSGLAVIALGNVMVGLSDSVSALVAWRIVAGAGSAAFMTGAMGYVADISTPANRGRLMSIQQGSLLLGVDIGPLIGGIVSDHWGLSAPFFMAGGLAAAAASWTAFRLPNRPPTESLESTRRQEEPVVASMHARDSGLSGTFRILRDPTFLLVGLFTFTVFATRSGSRMTLLPLITDERFAMSGTQLGLLFSVIATVNFILVAPGGWLSDRFGRKSAMVPGILLSVVGLLLFAWSGSVLAIFAGGVVIGIGQGVAGPSPAAAIADMAPPGRAASTMALYRTFGDLGMVVGPPILGLIGERFTLGTGLVANAVFICVVAALLAFVARETRRAPRAS